MINQSSSNILNNYLNLTLPFGDSDHFTYVCLFTLRDSSSMHGSLIVGIELRLSQLEDKLSDVDARASEDADSSANERDLDRFIYSGILSIFHIIDYLLDHLMF